MSICKHCKQEYKPIRSTSLYCSDKCRVYYGRKGSVTDLDNGSVTTPQKLSVSRDDNTQYIGKVIQGKCHGCGKDVPHYICICQECFRKGITHNSLNLKMCA